MERVRPGLDDVVGRTLPVEHHRRSARFDLELIDRVNGDAERQIAAFPLDHRVGHGYAFDVHVGREILAAHHVAPASDRLHARHEEHERGRIARSAGIHHERQRGVHVVADGLAEPGVGRREQRRRRRDLDALCDARHLERDVESDNSQGVDDDALARDGLEACEGDRDPILAGRKRPERVDAGARRLGRRVDAGGDIRRHDCRARDGKIGGVEHHTLNRSSAPDLGARHQRCEHQRGPGEQRNDSTHSDSLAGARAGGRDPAERTLRLRPPRVKGHQQESARFELKNGGNEKSGYSTWLSGHTCGYAVARGASGDFVTQNSAAPRSVRTRRGLLRPTPRCPTRRSRCQARRASGLP